MLVFPVPEVLECTRFVLKSTKRNQRTVRDYEFDLYINGDRDIYLDGVYHHISKGCLVFRKPGQKIVGYGDYNMFMLTLNFDTDKKTPPKKYFRDSNSPQQKICGLDILDNIPDVFIPSHQNELLELYEKLSKCSPPGLVDEEQQRQLVMEFLFLLFSDAYKHNSQKNPLSTGINSHIQNACHFIKLHYSENISVESIAKSLCINKNHLIRLFKEKLDTTPYQYIISTRLSHARSMLEQSDYSVGEIACYCGFNTPSHFIKVFKEAFGKTPLSYRSFQAANH